LTENSVPVAHFEIMSKISLHPDSRAPLRMRELQRELKQAQNLLFSPVFSVRKNRSGR